MTRAATGILVFGIYLALSGAILVVAPNSLFALIGIPPSTEIWPRVVGTLTLVLALYFISSARQEVIPFFRWTVYARVFVFVSFTLYVMFGFAGAVLILFGAVDLLGAIWTSWALRSAKPATA